MKKILGLLMMMELMVSVVGCDGNSDSPTGPVEIWGPEILLGTWNRSDAELGRVSMSFNSDGTFRIGGGGLGYEGTWSVRIDTLIQGVPTDYEYYISDNKLSFSAIGESSSYLEDFSFGTEDNATSLNGYTWKESDGTPLVFAENGRYIWGDSAEPFESGTWRVSNGLLTVSTETKAIYSVRGNGLTITHLQDCGLYGCTIEWTRK